MSNYIVPWNNTETDSVLENCYICYKDNKNLIFPCLCKGNDKGAHIYCLEKWIKTSKKDYCLVCKYKYNFKNVYSPSMKKFCNSCTDFKNLIFTKSTTIFIFLLLLHIFNFFILIILLTLIKDARADILVSVLSIVGILQILFTKFYDKSLNIVKFVKYSQFAFTFLIYVYLFIRIVYDYNDCYRFCWENKLGCNDNCTLYKDYKYNNTLYINALVYQSIIFGISLFLDLFLKIKNALYHQRISPYIPTLT